LGELIHEAVRAAVEQAIEEELEAALGAELYQRVERRGGYRNGRRQRKLCGPTGNLALEIPRATLFEAAGPREWSSRMLPRYERRLPEVNQAILDVYLAGANTRRVKAALRPLLKAAPLSRQAVSRVVGKLKASFEQWHSRRLESLEVAYLYLDAIVLRVRRAQRVVGTPLLLALAVLSNGDRQLLAMELCAGESADAWQGFLNQLIERGLRAPLLCVIDGNPGLRKAIELNWPKALVQRCAVHKLRNLKRKAPQHAHEEVADDFHRVVYAKSTATAHAALAAFKRKWEQRCPAVWRSMAEAGDELLTFYRFPQSQWKTLRTTNSIERLNEEFRRRIKTQSSMPTDDTALILFFGLIAGGHIVIRKLEGYRRLPQVLLDSNLRKAA
jgi:putative transposase